MFPMSDRFIQALGERDGSGLFGMTSFWLPHLDFSSMLFSSVPADLDAEWFNHKMAEKRREGASEVATREFRLDTATLTCWQYIPSPRRSEDLSGPAYWWPDYEATCQTAVGALEYTFYASFDGRKSGLPLFYGIIAGVTPVKSTARKVSR